MKILVNYIKESVNDIEFITEEYYQYYRRKKKDTFNFNLVSSGGHAAERDRERNITTNEVVELMKDVWRRFKKGIESGKILVGQRDTKKPGSSIAIHSADKTKTGYLTIIVFPSKYHQNADYYDIEVVTTWKGKEMNSYLKPDKTGKIMHHPEHGQLDMWDNLGKNHYNKNDQFN